MKYSLVCLFYLLSIKNIVIDISKKIFVTRVVVNKYVSAQLYAADIDSSATQTYEVNLVGDLSLAKSVNFFFQIQQLKISKKDPMKTIKI